MLPLIASAIGGLAQGLGQAAGGPNVSGVQGDYRAGGITVGSKVVGSGSASTSIPTLESTGSQPLYAQPDGTIGSGSAATAASILSQPWLPLVVGAVLIALAVVFTGRKK